MKKLLPLLLLCQMQFTAKSTPLLRTALSYTAVTLPLLVHGVVDDLLIPHSNCYPYHKCKKPDSCNKKNCSIKNKEEFYKAHFIIKTNLPKDITHFFIATSFITGGLALGGLSPHKVLLLTSMNAFSMVAGCALSHKMSNPFEWEQVAIPKNSYLEKLLKKENQTK